ILSEKDLQHSDVELSVVIPLYNEEGSLKELYEQIYEALVELSGYEIIFVDDGSTDKSWEIIKELCRLKAPIKAIRLQRNYGKSPALQAGFEKASGRYIATMDADLQDDPFEIPLMLQQLKSQQLDLVSGWKKKRHDPLTKTVPSRFFNKVTSLFVEIDLNEYNCRLTVDGRVVIDDIYVYGELHRYILFLDKFGGYNRIGEMVVMHPLRIYVRTIFGISRFMHGFLDLLPLVFVIRY